MYKKEYLFGKMLGVVRFCWLIDLVYKGFMGFFLTFFSAAFLCHLLHLANLLGRNLTRHAISWSFRVAGCYHLDSNQMVFFQHLI